MPGPTTDLSLEDFAERFVEGLDSFLPPDGLQEMAHHCWLVAKRNAGMNLTRIVEPEDMAVRHVLDSLAALPILIGTEEAPVTRVLDLGTGAGFPGLTLACAIPGLEMTLLDSTRKKVAFLAEVVDELGLQERVVCEWSRFEDYIRPHRKHYDLVLARAVGPLARLLEWTTNRWYGPMVLWKGPGFDAELAEAKDLMRRRRLEVRLDLPYLLPGDDTERRLVIIDI
ncbi:MAG: 16S rRNA (guanine(527)-N(7))-methyltransferase RsmG [Planctomycetes bacterium]|nr:16S rRNA (guanine(527)-N(7))-methyltransferase RsmG [Planctomycetota bacterium]